MNRKHSPGGSAEGSRSLGYREENEIRMAGLRIKSENDISHCWRSVLWGYCWHETQTGLSDFSSGMHRLADVLITAASF